MMITPRDIRVMKWIHGHGFVITRQIIAYMGVKKSAGHLRVKKLADAGFLKRRRIFHGQSRVITLTQKAIKLIDDDLPEMRNIPLGTYRHDLMLVDLCLHMEGTYWRAGHYDVAITPERRYKQTPFITNLKNVPDAVLQYDDKKDLGKKDFESTYVALELELSLKTKNRLYDVFANYSEVSRVREVYYFVTDKHVENGLNKVLEKYGFLINIVYVPSYIRSLYG